MPQIIPIKQLKNTSEISELCHTVSEPIYITKNGYGDMVLMSMDTYERLTGRLKMYEDLAVSEQRILDGETKDAEESLRALRDRYGL